MRMLIVSCVFPPEQVTSARTSADLYDMFNERVECVEVCCPAPSRGLAGADNNDEECKRNVKVLPSFKSGKSTLLSRFVENISFGLSSFFFVLFSKRYDVAYVNTWPLFAVLLTLTALKIRGTKVVYSVQDLYPESLLVRGTLHSKSVLYFLLKKLELLNCFLSDRIVCISEDFRDHITNEIKLRDMSKVFVIPNWPREVGGDADSFLIETKRYYKGRWQESDSIKFGYGGNFSFSTGVVDLVSSYKEGLYENHLIICGSGPKLNELKSLSSEDQNIHVNSPWPKMLTQAFYTEVDVCLLPIIDGQGQASVPSKLLDYATNNKPVICISNYDCPATTFILKNGLGAVVTWREFSNGLDTEFVSKLVDNYPPKHGEKAVKGSRESALELMSRLLLDLHAQAAKAG